MAQTPHSLSLSTARRIDGICDRFEAAWRQADRPRLEDWLRGGSEADRELLFGALLEVELELLVAAGKRPEAGAYRERFPQFARQVQAAFAKSCPAARPACDRRPRV